MRHPDSFIYITRAAGLILLSASLWRSKCPRAFGGRQSTIGSGLNPVQLGVGPALGKQRVVGPHLNHARAIEHDDEISHAHRAEAVGYQDGDPAIGGFRTTATRATAPRRGCVALEERVFGLGV